LEKDYRELFFSEANEYLKEVNNALVRLEKDIQDKEAVDIIFRHMHTLKGISATMGYQEFAELAHKLEDIFDCFRKEKIEISPKVMDVVFESVDVMGAALEQLKKEKPLSLDIHSYVEDLNRLLEEVRSKKEGEKIEDRKRIDESYINRLREEGKNIFKIKIKLVSDFVMKGAKAFLIFTHLKMYGEIINMIPDEESLKKEEIKEVFEFILATNFSSKEILKGIKRLGDIEKIEVIPFDISFFQKKKEKPPFYIKKIQSMRIPVERLDKIMNLMGELSIAKSRLVQTVQTKNFSALEETTYLIERLVSSLQDETLKMRLLSISYILGHFPRIVRDLSRKENKEVDLEIEGGEIELDRIVLDEISDPLIHLVRNAIDHGIELPQERIKIGKPPRGKISIKVIRERGHVVIEVSDDGRGIDFSKVAKIAVEKGIISPQDINSLDSHQILDILTSSGFSTSDKVTEVSGRGVGLDVVRNKLDALGGKLDLETHLGKGTKFILTLPLTLAIIKAMLVFLGGQIYAIPLMNIRETLKIKEEEVKIIKDIEVIRVREEIIPLIRLDREFGIKSWREDKIFSVVIVEGRAKSMGLVVDEVIGEQDIVVKPLGSFIKRVKGIAGATILGDGRIALILDVVNII